jgi:hypothetical protein
MKVRNGRVIGAIVAFVVAVGYILAGASGNPALEAAMPDTTFSSPFLSPLIYLPYVSKSGKAQVLSPSIYLPYVSKSGRVASRVNVTEIGIR